MPFPYIGETKELNESTRKEADGSFIALADGVTHYELGGPENGKPVAAVEALKLGIGGQVCLARILGCSEKTAHNGLAELAGLPDNPEYNAAIRKPGGGRKRYDYHHLDIDAQFLNVLKEHTAGDPMDEKIVWTDLTPQEIAKKMEQDHQVKVSKSVVNKLLKKHNYRRRKAQKKKTMKSVAYRNEQFLNIKARGAEFRASGSPFISFDTKKKESLGNFYRAVPRCTSNASR